MMDEQNTGPEKPRVEKVIVGKVVTRKKPLSTRFRETFVKDDARSVFGYVMLNTLLPAATDAIEGAANEFVHGILHGVSGGRTRRNYRSGGSTFGSSSRSSFIEYNKMSQQGSKFQEPRQQISRQGRQMHDFREIVLESMHEAREIIDNLFELINQYEVATVADLYAMLDQEVAFTDKNWGWQGDELQGSQPRRVRVNGRVGYLLDIPAPTYLD